MYLISYSGGKDSTLALYYALQKGNVLGLLMMLDECGERSRAHATPLAISQAQAECLNLPIISAPSSWQSYREAFVELLHLAKSQGATTLVTGDIDIPHHSSWYDDCVKEVGLDLYIPLLQKNRRSVVDEFIALGFTTMITRVDLNQKMTLDDLGKVLTPSYLDELESRGIDPCGESGEFHTLVLDGPIFQSPLMVTVDGYHQHEHYVVLQLHL